MDFHGSLAQSAKQALRMVREASYSATVAEGFDGKMRNSALGGNVAFLPPFNTDSRHDAFKA